MSWNFVDEAIQAAGKQEATLIHFIRFFPPSRPMFQIARGSRVQITKR